MGALVKRALVFILWLCTDSNLTFVVVVVVVVLVLAAAVVVVVAMMIVLVLEIPFFRQDHYFRRTKLANCNSIQSASFRFSGRDDCNNNTRAHTHTPRHEKN